MAVGVFLAAVALFLQRSQSKTEFEDKIVGRYREIVKPATGLTGVLIKHLLLILWTLPPQPQPTPIV